MGFECIEKCGYCCKGVPFDKEMFQRNSHKIVRPFTKLGLLPNNQILPYTEDMFCVFLRDDMRCNVYDERPQICRDFGCKNTKVKCPFLNTLGKKRGEVKIKQLKRIFDNNVKIMIKQRDKL